MSLICHLERFLTCFGIEWDKAEDFQAFIKSDQFGNFAASIKHLVNGPPTLQLFETNISPREAASASVVEIIRLSISNPENAETSTQAWERISRFLSGKKASVTYGTSSNLENEVVGGIIGWHSPEVRSDALFIFVIWYGASLCLH